MDDVEIEADFFVAFFSDFGPWDRKEKERKKELCLLLLLLLLRRERERERKREAALSLSLTHSIFGGRPREPRRSLAQSLFAQQSCSLSVSSSVSAYYYYYVQ